MFLRYRIIPVVVLAVFGAIAVAIGLFGIGVCGVAAFTDDEFSRAELIMTMGAACAYLALGVCWSAAAVTCWRAQWIHSLVFLFTGLAAAAFTALSAYEYFKANS